MRLTEDEYNALISRRKVRLAESPEPKGAERATGQSRRDQEKPTFRQSKKQPNKTEKRFELEHLEVWKRDDAIFEYQFEAVTLRLANGVRYIPDYLVDSPGNKAQIYEVKGGYIREDAMIKLKVAATQFKCFEFYLAQYKKRHWTITRVYP